MKFALSALIGSVLFLSGCFDVTYIPLLKDPVINFDLLFYKTSNGVLLGEQQDFQELDASGQPNDNKLCVVVYDIIVKDKAADSEDAFIDLLNEYTDAFEMSVAWDFKIQKVEDGKFVDLDGFNQGWNFNINEATINFYEELDKKSQELATQSHKDKVSFVTELAQSIVINENDSLPIRCLDFKRPANEPNVFYNLSQGFYYSVSSLQIDMKVVPRWARRYFNDSYTSEETKQIAFGID